VLLFDLEADPRGRRTSPRIFPRCAMNCFRHSGCFVRKSALEAVWSSGIRLSLGFDEFMARLSSRKLRRSKISDVVRRGQVLAPRLFVSPRVSGPPQVRQQMLLRF
jgi:hypothetical protein